MIDRLKALTLYGLVLKESSFRRAAAVAGQSVSTVSYHVSELERWFGSPLLVRTTRRLTPTSMGRTVGEQARIAVEVLENCQKLRADAADNVRGHLGVSLSSALIGAGIGDLIRSFTDAFPDIDLSVEISDERADLMGGTIDIAVRAGNLGAGNWKARRLGSVQRGFAAARGNVLGDDPRNPAISWLNLTSMPPTRTIVSPEGKPVTLQFANVVTVNSIETMLELAKAGIGVAIAPQHRIKTGREGEQLVNPFPKWTVDPLDIHLVWPDQNVEDPLRRVFIDHVVRLWPTVLR